MKKEYDFSKMKKREGKVKVYPEAAKTSVTLRLDTMIVGDIKIEAVRLGIPYQTLINSILHQYTTDQLIPRKTVAMLKELK